MTYALGEIYPAADAVARLTVVPFFEDGRCATFANADGQPQIPSARVARGESWLLDAALRIPLQCAGFRIQRVHAFAYDPTGADGLHLYLWATGDRYCGDRPHARPELVIASPAELAARLDATDPRLAGVVRDAAASFETEAETSYYADNLRLLEPAYLAGTTAQQGSGTSSDPARWRARREMIVDGIDRDGTFLDVGCANGLLMESVHRWAAERGLRIEPYGVDIGSGLVDLARRRLPHWSERIEVGNAIDYRPSSGARFTFVHLLFDLVPPTRRGDLVRHAVEALAEPGGRVLMSQYAAAPGPSAADLLASLRFRVSGSSVSGSGFASTGWIDVAD